MAQTKLVPQAPPVLLLALGAVTALLFPVHLYLIANAPVELQMGIVQKIFYFHVPSAYAMYVGFTLAMIGSVGYLWKRQARFDALAVAGAEVGLLFCVIVLITGPLWARNAWGTYWTWDPRLTTTLLAAMIFASFVALRSIGAAGEAEKRFASALGIVGFFLLPVIHYSVQAWRGQHPTVIMGGGGGLHPDMVPPLLFGFLLFTLLAIVLVWTRARAEMVKHRLAVLAESAASEGLTEDAACIDRTKMVAVCGAVVSSFVTAAAIAQDTGDRSTSFQAVTGSAHEDVPGGNLLVAAYAIALFVLALYVLYLTAMQQAAGKELTRLEALLNERAAKSEKKD